MKNEQATSNLLNDFEAETGDNNRMKKNVVLIIILLSFILGCATNIEQPSFNCTPIDSPYQFKQINMFDINVGWGISTENEILFTNSGMENFISIKNIEATNKTNDFISAAFIDEQTAYVAYFSGDNTHLIVEYTNDGGNNWNQTFVNSNNFADAGSVYISFSDAENGYLLYCSTPAAGMMTKLLFYTTDAGKTYSLANDLTNEITGYPTGISFSSIENGYIAVTYHGEDNYLYLTEDCAKTWESVKSLLKNNDIRYIDGYAPIFYGEDMQKGILVLKLVGDNISYNLFVTSDGGYSWKPEGNIPSESVMSYFAIDENHLFYIDELGNLFELSQ